MNTGYIGRYDRYNQLSELDAYTHQGFVAAQIGTTNLSIDAEQRLSGNARLYDYAGLKATVATQFQFSGLRWALSLSGRLYDFVELTDRNQQSVLASLRTLRSFETGTTIIFSGGLGSTRYTGDTGSSGTVEYHPTVFQLNGTLRLAQSLTPTTGLAVQYLERTLSGETPTNNIIEEDGVSYALLDDPTLYSLSSYGLELTQMVFDYALRLKAGAYYGRRKYLTQGNYIDGLTYNISDLRKDTYYSLWFKATYDIRLLKQDASIELGAQWMDTDSNSYWYTFGDSYLSLGIDYNF
jgi:hypothetical protein